MKFVIWINVYLCLVGLAGAAELPGLISYQGRLLTIGGAPYNGNASFTVDVHTNQVGGAALYSEALPTVPVQDGVYAFTFGQDKAALKQALANTEVYLEITVNGETMSPRERLVVVPYALLAEEVTGRADVDLLTVTGNTEIEAAPGTTNRPPYKFYPQVASVALSGVEDGAIIIETPVLRDANAEFALRVRGYATNETDGVIDFMVWGAVIADGSTNHLGNVDGLHGHVTAITFADAGTERFSKFLGISETTSTGTLALAIGERVDDPVNYRLTVDAWISAGTNDYSRGWGVRRSLAVDYGWGDVQGPYPSNLVPGLGARADGLDTRAEGDYSVALGVGTEARAYGSTVVGTYNDTSVVMAGDFWSAGNELFVVGNGFETGGVITRRNAMVIEKNGRAIFHNDVEIRGALILPQPQGDIPMWSAP